MIVSTAKCAKCMEPMAIMVSFHIAANAQKKSIGYLNVAIADGDEDNVAFWSERIARNQRAMDHHVERFKVTMKSCLRKNKEMYIDSDGTMWTCPPHKVRS